MELSFVDFNVLEGSFWIFCASLCILGRKYFYALPHTFWYVLSFLFVLFAVSDYIEAYFQIYFLTPEGRWLLMWKAFCIVGFIYCAWWYVRERLKKGRILKAWKR